MVWALFILFSGVKCLELPGSCKSDQYYDPGQLSCQFCPANASMVTSTDGFGCVCDDHSVPVGPGQCKPCSITEALSTDGKTCVPRKCQNVSGRVACRKCPGEYIAVTQNFDGSPMREVQCIKCARGYKPQGNICVRCESCSCARNQVVVRGSCVPKVYVNGRPSYGEKVLHPLELLDVVKHEYLCTKNDSRMCRTLANECVKNFYTSDPGGPCRLWLQPKLAPKGLPTLVVSNKKPEEMSLPRGKGSIYLPVAVHTTDGRMIFLDDYSDFNKMCQPPLLLRLGNDFSQDCGINLMKLSSSNFNGTFTPFLLADGDYEPLPVSVIKPNGHYVQRGSWPNSSFSRYFMVHNALSITTNATNTVYLRTLLIRLRIDRDAHANGSLRLKISVEAQYATADHDSVTTTLKVENVMPNAGVAKGLEVWGGILGAFLGVYSLVQWRGLLRRGGMHYCIVPLLAGTAADVLYFAALLATIHALAAEAGTLGMTLPLSKPEEKIIKDFLLSAVSLKVLKIFWINWKQCTCDIYFLNWSVYNSPIPKDMSTSVNECWKATTLAREWSLMQTMRRTSPGFTVTGALLILQLMTPWQSYLPQSLAYKWAISSIAWWLSYIIVIFASWMFERFLVSSTSALPKICTRVGISLLVFQEEYYAHYINGRNDDSKEVRSMAGPLSTCRVACVPQLRAVCKQLTAPAAGTLDETEPRQELLSKFLAAFFERALDGLNWVASERTVLERLVDVELTSREAGGTSALLYDDDSTPSCFAMTWWGEEWALATFDAMLFSCVLIVGGEAILSALVVIIVWQLLKLTRSSFGNKNQVQKTGVDIQIY